MTWQAFVTTSLIFWMGWGWCYFRRVRPLKRAAHLVTRLALSQKVEIDGLQETLWEQQNQRCDNIAAVEQAKIRQMEGS